MSDEHIEKLEKTLENFGDFLEEKIGESLVEHKAVWNTLANFGDFLVEHKKIIVVVVGTSLLVGFFAGWETVLMMIGSGLSIAVINALYSSSMKLFFKAWSVGYYIALGGFILVKLGLLPSEY